MRRFIREGYVRYAFTRFGVPYVVSIQCLDSAPRARRLACREAYPVAERFLKALRIAGGQPSRPRRDIPIRDRGTAGGPASPDFTYRASGDIIARSGSLKTRRSRRLHGLFADPFSPGADARSPSARNNSAGATRPHLVAGAYPWRDNFCEARSFNVGQCASGFGHQGQDIRPVACPAGQRKRGGLQSQAAADRRCARWRRDPLTEAAGSHAADQHPHRAHPLPLHAHEPLGRWMRMACSTAAGSPKVSPIGMVSQLSRPSQRYQLPSAFRRPGVHPRRLALGQSLHHADLGL